MSPTEILEGGVKIIQNEYLSYVKRVNWEDIVNSADIVIEDNGPESEWKDLNLRFNVRPLLWSI